MSIIHFFPLGGESYHRWEEVLLLLVSMVSNIAYSLTLLCILVWEKVGKGGGGRRTDNDTRFGTQFAPALHHEPRPGPEYVCVTESEMLGGCKRGISV